MEEVSAHGEESESLIIKGEIENREVALNSLAVFFFFFFLNLRGLFCFKSSNFLLFHFLVFNIFFLKIVHNFLESRTISWKTLIDMVS